MKPISTTYTKPYEVQIPESNLAELLTSKLRDQPVWADLVEAFADTMAVNVDGPMKQFEELRFLPPDTEPAILADLCRMLGFDLSQDILNMSVDRFMRIATQLGMYPDINGTEGFTNFLGLMINGYADITNLYTTDYVNFEETPGTLITEGGPWFKTTHVGLNIGFSTLDGLILKSGEKLSSKLKSIFYAQAPITLVIEHYNFTVDVEVEPLGFQVDMLPREISFDLE